jgi:signal-transduction protein with cAMP-binding, CBS, and nucleotidyltransferase domain
MDFARALKVREQGTEAFVRLARKITAMPVALGFFGGLRVERSGEHRGEFNVEEFALAPLVKNITILACRFGLSETGTIPRIKKLVGNGRLDVELGDRLLRAYHEFSRQRIVEDVTRAVEAPSGFYLNPENLNDEDMNNFKNGLESVATLQTIVYQVFAEQG